MTDAQIEQLMRCEYLPEHEVRALCLKAREILVDEGNIQRVEAPVTICGGGHTARARAFVPSLLTVKCSA